MQGIWHIWIGLDHILFLLSLLLPAVLVHETGRRRGVGNFRQALVERRRWMVAFGFGLIHGFGFASVLAEPGLPQGTLVLSLLGFNLGVEAGQLAIVAVFLPVAYALRETPFYRRAVFVGGSLATLTIALIWFAERALDLKLISA